MADLNLEWKGTLSLTPSGDLALSSGPTETRQRVERRIFTAVRAYVWHQDYGAGLPQKIGRVARAANIQSLVRSQIALESSVARTPIPVVTVTESQANLGLFSISIQYVDAATGEAVSLNLEIPTTT